MDQLDQWGQTRLIFHEIKDQWGQTRLIFHYWPGNMLFFIPLERTNGTSSAFRYSWPAPARHFAW